MYHLDGGVIIVAMNEGNTGQPPPTTASTTVPPQPSSPSERESVEVGFRIFADERQQLDDFIEMAYLLKLIPEQNLQRYMVYCLNCGAMFIQMKVKPK